MGTFVPQVSQGVDRDQQIGLSAQRIAERVIGDA
jgi:hypothetical protein